MSQSLHASPAPEPCLGIGLFVFGRGIRGNDMGLEMKRGDKDLSERRLYGALHRHWLLWKSDMSSFLPAIFSECPAFISTPEERSRRGEVCVFGGAGQDLSFCLCI